MDLIGAEIGVDMNPLMGDYGFVVNEQVDASDIPKVRGICGWE